LKTSEKLQFFEGWSCGETWCIGNRDQFISVDLELKLESPQIKQKTGENNSHNDHHDDEERQLKEDSELSCHETQ